jgi:hypothetical protein
MHHCMLPDLSRQGRDSDSSRPFTDVCSALSPISTYPFVASVYIQKHLIFFIIIIIIIILLQYSSRC